MKFYVNFGQSGLLKKLINIIKKVKIPIKFKLKNFYNFIVN